MEQVAGNDPVTTLVRRHVKPGRERDYEAWLAGLLADAQRLDGYLGAEVLRPARTGEPYTSIFRFASLAQLTAFEASEMRRDHLGKVAALVVADPVWERLSGLEVWYDAPPGTVAPQPIRWRMALVLIVVVYVLVEILSRIAGLLPIPAPARILLVVTCQVLLLTYLLMPLITRLLARWLFPQNP